MKAGVPPDVKSSQELLRSAQAGDERAKEDLCRRYHPLLLRYAHGRLPRQARSLLDTQDIVQETLIGTLARLDGIEYRHQGAVQAYLLRALRNRIIDEVRRSQRMPACNTLEEGPSRQASPLEQAIGSEAVGRFESAFARLRPADQEAIAARIELGLSYAEVAELVGKPSPDAARMAVSRALVRLVKEMANERRRGSTA